MESVQKKGTGMEYHLSPTFRSEEFGKQEPQAWLCSAGISIPPIEKWNPKGFGMSQMLGGENVADDKGSPM